MIGRTARISDGKRMILSFRRNTMPDTIGTLYGAIVAQARLPAFYGADYGVPDTVDGRLDLLILHVALFFRRARDGDEALRGCGQEVFDRFCRNMDDNMRELGLSDDSLAKKMRKIGEAFYGRAAAYDAALAAPDNRALVEALGRNVFGDHMTGRAVRLAAYVRAAVESLALQSAADLNAGVVRFPDPQMVPVA
jgi:cytochrome b pre-mRNA-processing protein 3